MATEIAKAYVQLVPSAKGFKGGIKSAIGGDVSSAGEEAGVDDGEDVATGAGVVTTPRTCMTIPERFTCPHALLTGIFTEACASSMVIVWS